MRVLIADRNARLLESIARTFADRFSIQTATTYERCNDLLLRDAFDLVVISEKLADGAGLKLLGQIVRNSPDTLRVFAARRSRLQLLRGKLGPFGLFRTLNYPIDPKALQAAFTLARAGLEVETPAQEALGVPDVGRRTGDVQARDGSAELPVQAKQAGAPIPVPAAVQSTVEQISLTCADAMFAVDVPKTIAKLKRRRRRPNSPPTPQPLPIARGIVPASPADKQQSQQRVSHPASVTPQPTRVQQAGPQPASSQSAAAHAAAPARVSSPSEPFRQALVRGEDANRARGSQFVARPSQLAGVHRAPMRTKVVLGAMIAAVFLVTTLTLNVIGARADDTRVAAPTPEKEQPAPPGNSTPVEAAPQYFSPSNLARHVVPKSDVEPVGPQIAASTPPVADPSSFGSEAYEAIYSN
jgi:hypothetical protein